MIDSNKLLPDGFLRNGDGPEAVGREVHEGREVRRGLLPPDARHQVMSGVCTVATYGLALLEVKVLPTTAAILPRHAGCA